MTQGFRHIAVGTMIVATTLTLPLTTHAQNLKPYSVFVGAGYSNFLDGTNNNTYLVTPAQSPASAEIDQLAQSNHGSSAGYTIGFARTFDLANRTQGKLQSISTGLTLRYDPVTFNGQVWQYQDPTQNNYSYRYQVRPISALVESDLILPKIKCFTPFGILGVGFTESNLTYRETAINGAQSVSAQTASRWVTNPDVAAGGGLLWNFKNNRYFVKTQYLYQYRGTARLELSTFAQGVPVSLNEQSADVLLGMRLP